MLLSACQLYNKKNCSDYLSLHCSCPQNAAMEILDRDLPIKLGGRTDNEKILLSLWTQLNYPKMNEEIE